MTEIAESVGCAAQTTTGPFSGSSKAIGNGGAINRLSHGVQGLIGAALNIVGRMPDLERGITRIFHRTATAAEVVLAFNGCKFFLFIRVDIGLL